MLCLKDMVGKGLHRECYVHPEDERLCVKVVVNGDDKETKREKAYYKRLTKQNNKFSCLPKYYGDVKTDKGSGGVFDLIRDADGSVSKTLEYYLESPEVVAENMNEIYDALETLKAELLEQGVVTMTIKPKNIVYQLGEDGKGKLIIIDNIGSSSLLRPEYFSLFFARKKVMRKWSKFKESLVKNYKITTL